MKDIVNHQKLIRSLVGKADSPSLKRHVEVKSKNPPSDKKKYVPTLDDGDRLHYPVMRNLTHYYYSVENYAMSYLFSKLLHLNNDRSSNITMIREELAKQVDVDDIDEVAKTLHDALKDGEFSTKFIPLRLKNGKI